MLLLRHSVSKYTEIHSKTEKIRYPQQSTEQCELVTITVPDSFSQERKKWHMKIVFVLPEDRCCRVQPCTPAPCRRCPLFSGAGVLRAPPTCWFTWDSCFCTSPPFSGEFMGAPSFSGKSVCCRCRKQSLEFHLSVSP